MIIPLALLQTWHELEFNLGQPEDIDSFPWSAPVSVIVLLLLGFFFIKGRRNYLALPELKAAGKSGNADVTVIIPARNEEGKIGACVASFPGTRVIVADDGSTDRTAQAAAKAGAEVVAVPAPHRGAMGKPNAMAAAEKLVLSDYVLFVDADTVFRPGFLPAAVQFAEENQCILLSAFLQQECLTLFEKILIPFVFGLYFCGVSAKRIHDVLSPETLANGQCMLFLRSAYEFCGGHMSVQTSVLEDIAITEKVKRHRMKLQVMRAEKLGRVRMYDSLGAMGRGFQKNAFRFLRVNRRTGMQVILTAILLTSILPLAVWLGYQDQWPFLAALLIGPALLLKPWYGSYFKALLYLPAVYLFLLIALTGMFRASLGLKTDWKGRKV